MFERVRADYMPMQMTPHYWQLCASLQTNLLLLTPLTGIWLGFRSDAITGAWYRILTKLSLQSCVDPGLRALPRGDLILSSVSIRASPNIDILGVKFYSKLTFEDHVRGIVSRVSQRIGILRLVTRIFVDTSVLLRCYFAFVLRILEYCSPCGVNYWMSPSASWAPGVLGGQAFSRSEFLVDVSSTSCGWA